METEQLFEVKIAYDKLSEDGDNTKTHTESLIVNADCYAAVEEEVVEQMGAFPNFAIKDIKLSNYDDIVFRNKEERDESYFKCKLESITNDEVTGREKKNKAYYLVNANTLEDAYTLLKGRYMETSIFQVEAINVAITPIVDVLF